MNVRERQNRIVEIIRNNEAATVGELAAQLDISRETIRRDLSSLAEAGKIKKVHGGATIPHAYGESPFQHRMLENAAAKMKIASKAVSFFKPGESLFINTGTTTIYLAEKIADLSGLTIISNSSEIVNIASTTDPGNKIQNGEDNSTFFLGGEYDKLEKKTYGTMAISQIRSFRAHHAVISIGALDARSGAMDFNIEAAQISRAMIEQSQSLTILMDATKYNKLASFEICSLSKIDRLIVNCAPADELAESLKAAEVEVIVVH